MTLAIIFMRKLKPNVYNILQKAGSFKWKINPNIYKCNIMVLQKNNDQ